jgi:hypothetical protein
MKKAVPKGGLSSESFFTLARIFQKVQLDRYQKGILQE